MISFNWEPKKDQGKYSTDVWHIRKICFIEKKTLEGLVRKKSNGINSSFELLTIYLYVHIGKSY